MRPGTLTRLILYCISFSIIAQSVRLEDVAVWKHTFNQIFGSNADTRPDVMLGTELMRAMSFLHAAGTNLDSISQHDKEQVDFWFDKLFGFTALHDNIEDCNKEYLQKIFDRYSGENTESNPNFEQIYLTVQRNIVEFCARHFSDLPSLFMINETMEYKLVNLWESYNKIDGAYRDESNLARLLKNSVLQLIDVDRKANGTMIRAAWTYGPCQVILSTLKQPGKKKYSDFIDMYLFDPESLLSQCSGSTRQWINFVDMCRQLDTSIAKMVDNIDYEARKAEDLWKSVYNEVFATNSATSTMSLQRMLHSLMYLHGKADRLASVDESHKKVVAFWFDSLIEVDKYDCNVEHVRRMTAIYNRQNRRNNPNFKLLYISWRKTLMDYCDGCFVDLPEHLASRVSDDNLLKYLEMQVLQNQNVNPGEDTSISNQDLAEILADCAIKSSEAGKRGTQVMRDWRLGPCEAIQTGLREPNMRQYSDFIELSLLDKRAYLMYCYVLNNVWIRVVHMCRILDRWMPYFADNDSLASIMRPLIKHNFGINSLDKMMDTPIPTTVPSSIPLAEQDTVAEPLPEERIIQVVSASPTAVNATTIADATATPTTTAERPRSSSTGSSLSPLTRNRMRAGNPLLARYRRI